MQYVRFFVSRSSLGRLPLMCRWKNGLKSAFSAKCVKNAVNYVRDNSRKSSNFAPQIKKHFIMEEFRVDPRVTTPEARAMYIEQGRKLFAFNQTRQCHRRRKSCQTDQDDRIVKIILYKQKNPTKTCTCGIFFVILHRIGRIIMTYNEYIAQEQQAMDEEQQDDSCFLAYQPEGQFVRGH